MGFGAAVSTCFRKYATFQGRARRSEFWFFYLFVLLVSIPLQILDMYVVRLGHTTYEYVLNNQTYSFETYYPLLSTIWSLAVLLPLLGVQVRRLHDTNRSGWWWWIILLSCFCGIGLIILIVFWALDGTRGENRFGPDPKV